MREFFRVSFSPLIVVTVVAVTMTCDCGCDKCRSFLKRTESGNQGQGVKTTGNQEGKGPILQLLGHGRRDHQGHAQRIWMY
jgi:hypothetical protein